MVALLRIKKFAHNTRGDAVVEAAILFPIMIMIFAALVLLAVYLPARSALQNATQYAATALATEWSDTWLFHDDASMSFYWENDKSSLENVYASLFSGVGSIEDRVEDIVNEIEGRSISSKAGEMRIGSYVVNRVFYREIVVTATREFTVPVNLSFIRFPETIPISVTSTAAVQDGDEFVRNIDIAADFTGYISEKFGLTDVADSISSFGSRITSLLGW